MKITAILAMLAPLCACRAPSGEIDYRATADTMALYRQDVLDVLYLAEPDTQERVRELAASIERVESALRLGDMGTASSAASLAIALADALVLELAPDSDLRLYVALAKIALRHIQGGQPAEVEPPAAPAPATRPSK